MRTTTRTCILKKYIPRKALLYFFDQTSQHGYFYWRMISSPPIAKWWNFFFLFPPLQHHQQNDGVTMFSHQNDPDSHMRITLYWKKICPRSRPCLRLQVVPHFSSGIVEWTKRERMWKSPHARKGDTGSREYRLSCRGDFHARSHFARSTIPEEKWGTTCSLSLSWNLHA